MESKIYEKDTLKKLQNTELDMLGDFIDICEKYKLSYFGIGGTAIGALRHGGFIPWDDDIDLAFTRKDFDRFCRIVNEEWKDKYTILSAKTDPEYPLFTARMCKNGTVFKEYAMKELDCNFGIFLDLYAYDNVPDQEWRMRIQGIRAWLYSKILILCSIEKPNIFLTGWKAHVVLAGCRMVSCFIRCLRISKKKIYEKGLKCCTAYNDSPTKRLAYLPEARPFTSMIGRKDLFPLQKLPFEHLKLYFPNNMHDMLQSYYGDYMELPPEEKRYNHCPWQLDFGGDQ